MFGVMGVIKVGSSGFHEGIHKAIQRWKTEAIEPELEKRCRRFCSELCLKAIEARRNANGAHDYTGNLLNSIVTCLYKNKQPIIAYYAAQYTYEAIDVKMSGTQSRGGRYHFDPDYSGRKSNYVPLVETDRGWGVDDARDFFQSYRPSGNDLFNIVVAYPVEYANWVEMHRQTTGFVATLDYAEKNGIALLSIPYGK